MIVLLPSFNLAKLVDGQLVTGTHTPGLLIPSWTAGLGSSGEQITVSLSQRTVPNLIGSSQVKVCSGYSIGIIIEELALLTDDGRVLVGCKPIISWLNDITPTVQYLFGCDTANIQSISINGRSLIVWSYSAVGVIHLDSGSVPCSVYLCQLPSEIDIISINEHYFLVKTRDNRLFGIMHTRSSSDRPCVFNERNQVAFHDVENIIEIHTDPSSVLLLMENGQVYACEYSGPFCAERSFMRVQLPEDEAVVKVVNTGTYVIYTTAAGNCYKQDGRNWLLAPVIVRGLQGYVENVVAICSDSILVQCNNSSSLKAYRVRFFAYVYGPAVETTPLPALDGLTVTTITYQAMRTCFVTDEGSVFWSYNILDAEPIITRDPFFDSNLLAVGGDTARIRSAGSLIKNK